jgi:hypothetical protein
VARAQFLIELAASPCSASAFSREIIDGAPCLVQTTTLSLAAQAAPDGRAGPPSILNNPVGAKQRFSQIQHSLPPSIFIRPTVAFYPAQVECPEDAYFWRPLSFLGCGGWALGDPGRSLPEGLPQSLWRSDLQA